MAWFMLVHNRKFKLRTQIKYTFFLLGKCYFVNVFQQEINEEILHFYKS